MKRLGIQISVTISLLVLCSALWLSGGKPADVAFEYYSVIVSIVVLFAWFWEKYVWRWGWTQRLPIVPKNISGTWNGILTSFWKDPATNDGVDPKPVILVVRQTASAVFVRLLTDESASKSSLAKVTLGSDGYCLDYLYMNEPESRFRRRSPIHRGSCSMSIAGKPASTLRGSYWTDRGTDGELEFLERSRKHADSYRAGMALFEEK